MEDYTQEYGHFSLPLNAFQSQAESNLSHTIAKVRSLLDDYTDGFTANAIRNLLGAMHFFNKSPEKSLECFQQVLQNNDQNRNALLNQIFVYKRLLRTRKAYETRSKLIEKAKQNPNLQSCIQYAEFGFAYIFDCHLNDDRPRLDRCTHMFERAVTEVEKTVIGDNRLLVTMEIKFWAMQGYQKRYMSDQRDRTPEDTFNKAVAIIHQIVKQIESNEMKEHRDTNLVRNVTGVSWAYLGFFFSKKPNVKWNEKGLTEVDENLIPNIVETCGFIEEYKNPRLCFDKALKENKDNREIRIRYACFLKNIQIDSKEATEDNKIRLDDAIKHVEHSLKIDNSEANRFGRTIRASIFFTKFKLFKDKNDLVKAIDDWETSLTFSPTSTDFQQLAEAYHMMAIKDGSNEELDYDKEEWISKASINFWKAVKILGTSKFPEIHRSHGRFLRCLGDKREAIECFKRALEIDTAHKPTKSFEHLFETFLQMYEDELKSILKIDSAELDSKELRVDRLLYEIAFWFRFAIKRYNVLETVNKSSPAYFGEQTEHRQMMRSFSLQADIIHTSGPRSLNTDEAADLFKKHTRRFMNEYKQGMAHLCAYFGTVTEGSSYEISKIIEQSAEFKTFEDGEWKTFQDNWSEHRAKLHQKAGITSCPTCGNLTEKISFSESPDKARNENFKYDFFVIYPENQREWVLYSLLQKVEGVYGYKGAIIERDASPGENIIESTRNLIQNSSKVLAILTREFYTDRWCMRNLDTAEVYSLSEKRTNFIIPILLETGHQSDRFNTIICLDAVDYFDWDKLIRSISQR